jgi:uncharacterized protein (DUF58 family)
VHGASELQNELQNAEPPLAATLLDPVTLSKLGPLQMRARRVVEGILTGLHRSPYQGQSVEFAQHKEYAPGDEIRHIDWRVYARADKHYVKRFELETNLRAYILLDASASMAYGRSGVTKLDYAKMLAAALAHLLTRQQDTCGLVIAGAPEQTPSAASGLYTPAGDLSDDEKLPKGVRRHLPPRASPAHFNALIDQLEVLGAHGDTDLAAAASFVAEKAGRRALVFVLSDLLDPGERALKGITQLRQQKCEVTVFHLLDPDELEFPFEDPTEFLALEGEARLEANPSAIRDGYLEELRAFLAVTKKTLASQGVDYALAPTNGPLDKLLLNHLSPRRGPRGGR